MNAPERVPASAAARTLRIVGDAWILRILRDAFRGTRRFGDWQRNLGIPRAVLAGRLTRLTDAQVLERDPTHAARPEYRLTERGLDLWPLMIALWAWETRWTPDPREQRQRLIHLACGRSIRPVCRCAGCSAAVSARDTEALPGPGARGTDPALPPRYQRRSEGAGRNGRAALNSHTALILGDRWAAAIVASGFRGLHRFGEFERSLGISPHLLADRLERLVAMGIFERRRYQDAPPRDAYHFTDKGLEFFPVTLELVRWGDRWLAGPRGAPLTIIHRPCGQAVGPVLACSYCGGRLERKALRLEHLMR